MSSVALRNAFSDFHGLAEFERGFVPTAQTTMRRIFVADRRGDHGRPDHFYKAYLDQKLGSVRHVAELPWVVLSQLASRYLERRDDMVAVRLERFLEWHELLPFISPLCVVVAFLVAEKGGPSPGEDPRDFIADQIGETALISTSDLHLSDLIERDGLHELHMHLNGSTELDVLWADAVQDPDAFYREIAAARTQNGSSAAELYDQLEPGLEPFAVFKRLRAARRVRRWVSDQLRSSTATEAAAAVGGAGSIEHVVELMGAELPDGTFESMRGVNLAADPSDLIFGASLHRPIVKEAAWLYTCLRHLRRRPDDLLVGTGLYFTMLVLSLIRRLAVQQADEFGFDQFQKYTKVGTREGLEKRYVARLRQLNLRAPYDVLAHLEGRFAPKDTEAKGRRQLATIVTDFQEFAGCRRRAPRSELPMTPPPCLTSFGCPGLPCEWSGRRLTELSLVAHFIKQEPSGVLDIACGARDSVLRMRVERQSRVLKRLLRNGTIRSVLGGVDAAANELHAGAEPFSAAFRISRRAGVRRATFHAGEDFRHLISGMRAVEEALTYLEFGPGDRIGHATSVGIDPALWTARAGPRALLARLDLLDDAVFAHQRLAKLPPFAGEIVRLETLIAVHSTALYGEELSAALLAQEWALRSVNPLMLRKVERSASKSDASGLAKEARHLAAIAVDEEEESELLHVVTNLERHGSAYDVFRRRHELSRKRCSEWIEVDAELLSHEAYTALQDHVIREANDRGVAFEVLPTSNVRISYYHSLEDHHLFRWLGLRGPPLANLPSVVIGSDDPGIFATHLKNEFAAVGAVLRSNFGMTAEQAAEVLTRLNDTARVRRFRPRSVGGAAGKGIGRTEPVCAEMPPNRC